MLKITPRPRPDSAQPKTKCIPEKPVCTQVTHTQTY